MENNVGVWIDHHKAMIVRLTEEGHEMRSVESEVDAAEQSGSAGEDLLVFNSASHLNAFYEKIVSAVRGAESVLILGPGEEKVELGVRLPGSTLGEHIAGIETASAMTEEQIAAKIREHFR